jgi:transcriptional regulator with XRE-family HTH domain
MSTQKWSDDQFGSRVKRGREERRWSQAEMAKMLCDRGVEPMHATTIAKIEGGTRSVRINEALGIADLFGISLDTLMGRANEPDDAVQLAFALRLLRDTARTASDRTLDEVREIQQYVRQITDGFEFDGSDELKDLAGVACRHLDEAYESVDVLAQQVEDVMKATDPITRRRKLARTKLL